MDRIQARRKQVDKNDYLGRMARAEDCSRFLNYPVEVYEGNQLKIAYYELSDDQINTRKLIKVLDSIEFQDTRRTAGMSGTARTFGYMPRRTLRNDFCHLSALADENPSAHQEVYNIARLLNNNYRAANEATYQAHVADVEKVRPQYRIPDTVFTSGIINKNYTIPYHFDAGNIQEVWSVMLCLKRGIEGGNLCVPEYDLCFELKHNSLFMFDGQGLLHGVTPIVRKRKDAVRYTLVYYSMVAMWRCLTNAEEVERIRKVKTAREDKRAAAMRDKNGD